MKTLLLWAHFLFEDDFTSCKNRWGSEDIYPLKIVKIQTRVKILKNIFFWLNSLWQSGLSLLVCTHTPHPSVHVSSSAFRRPLSRKKRVPTHHERRERDLSANHRETSNPIDVQIGRRLNKLPSKDLVALLVACLLSSWTCFNHLPRSYLLLHIPPCSFHRLRLIYF